MSKTKEVRLSPSRINSINDCSWQYYCSYHLRLPRTGNDGSRRGTICHAVLECLVRPRHQKYIQMIIDADDVYVIPSIKRMMEIIARREKLQIDQVVVNMAKDGLMTHRDEMSKMIIVGLKNRFLGEPGDEIKTEIKHEIKVYDKEKKKAFHILGIIDKVFIRRNPDGTIREVEIVDYKTSSKKFDESDIDSNLQGLAYQFFAKNMFPDVKNIKFKFLFLRFPRSPVQEVPYMVDESVDGFEYYLSYISSYMSKFTEKQAKKNFAKYGDAKFLCGLYGNKKYFDKKAKVKIEHPEPQFICAIRAPFEYYAIIDDEGNNIRSAMTIEELKAGPNEKTLKRSYLGCPAWHAQKQALKRDWNILQ